MILVDTNVWSETTKRDADPNVSDWLVKNDAQLILSPIVLTEIFSGIDGLLPSKKRTELEAWAAALERDFLHTMLDFGALASRIAGRLIAERKLQKQETKLLDMLLAAQGMAHDMPIATRNVKDFQWTGVAVIDPWIP